MSHNHNINDLIRIAHAGGGFRISAIARPIDDLIRIAHAASNNGARIFMTGILQRPVDDLVRIGHAGKGCVVFED